MPGLVMPKKKSASERSPRNKERKDLAGFKTVAFRVSVEYAGWLERAAKHDRLTIAAFLDRAAADYAARLEGFDEPPPDRIP